MTTTEYDVLVVGAGILGLSISYHIKEHAPSKDVFLVDRFAAVAQGNTARSNAMFRNTFTSRDNVALADSSIDYYLEVQNELGIDLGLKKCGYLWLMSERQASKGEANIRKLKNCGIELREYTREDLQRLLPALRSEFSASDEARLMDLESIAAGIFGEKCGRLDPTKLANYYKERFLALGGKIAVNTNVTSLIVEPRQPLGIEGEPFTWQESNVAGAKVEGAFHGELRAKKTIVAAGAWNNELLEPIGLDGHVKAKKRQLFTLTAKKSEELERLLRTRTFSSEGFPFAILPKNACFVKGVEENREFWVGCDDDFNRPFINVPDANLEDCKPEPEYFERSLYPILRQYFPAFEGSRAGQMWAGYYAYNTLDSIPFAFEENDLIVAGGQSGSGIMKADALGRIVEALYRLGEDGDATLHGGRGYRIRNLGFKNRSVEREEWVI